MNYLMLVCVEGEGSEEQSAVMREHTPRWVDEMDGRGLRLVGKPLDEPQTARSVRVRDGETLVTDGPFADTKEFIGGLDLLDCENLDEAIEVASKHPMAWFHSLELRPFFEHEERPELRAEAPIETVTEPRMGYLLMVCINGIAEPPEVEEGILGDVTAWRERVEASGEYVYGHALQDATAATTVRVRDGRTLLTDGPFVETREFLGGFAILDCDSEQRAIEVAAEHPIARFHQVEVRRFRDL
jgi:hypothetical protein